MFHPARSATLLSLFVATVCKMAPAQVAQIELVADLRTGSTDTENSTASPGPFGVLPTSSGPLAIFTATDSGFGIGVWASDGTIQGTRLARDFTNNPYSTGGSPRQYTLYNNRLYFLAVLDSGDEYFLCSTDGSSCGSQVHFKVRNSTGTFPRVWLTAMGPWLYYVGLGQDHSVGVELHRTDGTLTNTTLIADLSPGAAYTSFTEVVASSDRIFMAANTTPNSIGNELWVCDGNTITPIDIAAGPNNSIPNLLTIIGNTCYFAATTSATGTELWKSDGTVNGTVLVADIIRGTPSSRPRHLSSHDGKLYFSAESRNADNSSRGRDPFIYDGTSVTLLADVTPNFSELYFSRFVSNGPDTYFLANDSTSPIRLYRTRGTPSTTVQVAPSLEVMRIPATNTGEMASTANGLVFRARPNAQTRSSLWRTNGEVGDAVNIHAVIPGGANSEDALPYYAPMGDGRIVFRGVDFGFNSEPWITDGTPAGTFRLHDTYSIAPTSQPRNLLPWGDRLIFYSLAEDSVQNYRTTSGTAATTQLLYESRSPTIPSGNLDKLTLWAGGAAFISEFNGSSPTQIFSVPVPGAPALHLATLNATDLFAVNNSLLASVNSGSTPGLFVISPSGGTPTLLDPMNRPLNASMSDAAVMNGWLYFTAQRQNDGSLLWLWRTDGVTAEPITRLSIDGDNVSDVARVIRAGDRLFMRMTTPLTGTELWTSDGTASGTRIVTDLYPGTVGALASHDISAASAVGDRIVVRANHPTLGVELFISDGSANGTYCLGDLMPGIADGARTVYQWWLPNDIQTVGSTIFATGTSPDHGSELWMSDGSPNSLIRISDIFPGPDSSNPRGMITDGERLYFLAEGCDTGQEFYAADTQGNIAFLAETIPGPKHGGTQYPTWCGGSIYFTHNHSTFGRELFRIRTAPCAADFNADTVFDFFDYLDFVSAFAANEPAADFNQDSVIDFFDYLDFVASFAAGC